MYVGFVRIPSALSSREAAKEVLAAHKAVDVLQIARHFGGGGQPYAAGARIFDAVTADVIEKLYEKLRLLFPLGLPTGTQVHT